ncbi:MAG: hypothetical protein ABFD96_05975 [Armatimonadia bacterium]
MPITYTTLIASKETEGSIKYFVRHTEVPSTYILERAQDAIYQLLRVREMTTRLDGTIATDASTLAMPADILEPIALFRRGASKGRIRILDQEHFESRVGENPDDANNVYSGTPCFATFDGTTFYFDAKADEDYPYRLWYVRKPALLASGTNETNFLTLRYGNILEAMCKHYAYAHREMRQEANEELEKATGYILKANEEFDMFKQSIQTEMYWSQD